MEQFVELMRNATELVGIEAVRLWPKMVFLHWINGILHLAGFGAMVTIGFMMVWVKANLFDDPKSTGKDFTVLIIGAALVFIGSIALMVEGPSLLARILEPEADLVIRLFRMGGR